MLSYNNNKTYKPILNGPPKQNQDLVQKTIEKQIDQLLQRMTLEEKVGQMVQLKIRSSDQLNGICALISNGSVGSVIVNISDPQIMNIMQKIAIDKTRLGIPLLFAKNVVHGFRTCFPVCIAEASTWDPELIERATTVAATEAIAAGYHWTLSPVIDIARDTRWGRQVEGAGEDPYLGSAIGAARVRGLQHDPGPNSVRLAACLKHFAGYGGAEAGIDYNGIEVSSGTFRDIYLPPFATSIDKGAVSIMSSFNEINGTPVTANHHLLSNILRDEWGFEGLVVSDYDSIAELIPFGLVHTRADAAVRALEAGIDMDLCSNVYLEELVNVVREKRVPEEMVDKAVRRILRVKFWCRLFEYPYVDIERRNLNLLSPEHIKIAHEVACNSIVLLKNENNVLPLEKKVKNIAVIGPFADNQKEYLGRWSCEALSEEVITILNGIRNKLGTNTTVVYETGCEVTDDIPQNYDDAEFAAKGDGARFFGGDQEYTITDTIQRAVAVAQNAEYAILVLGQTSAQSGEGSYVHTFDLPSHQQQLLEQVVATGTPTVLLLMGGRPLTVRWAKEHVPTIVQAWELGTQAGTAVADVLFGDFNPCGKLSLTIGRHISKEPVYYNYKRTGRPKMRYFDYLYPFGYGLSYTNFEYRSLHLSNKSITFEDELTITLEIINTGDRFGKEVAQLYIRDDIASMTRPVKSLKRFQKFGLQPGETKRVCFSVTAQDLGFYNNEGSYVIEPGTFTLWVGPHSEEGLTDSFELKT